MKSVNWSSWSLGHLQQCGEKFRRRHIEKERTLKTPSLVRGIAVHDQAEANFKGKLEQGILFAEEEAKEYAANRYEKLWADGVKVDKDDVREFGGEANVRGTFKDQAVKISGHHSVAFAPAINPIAVEKEVRVTPRGFDYELVTRIDLVDMRTVQPQSFSSSDVVESVKVIRDTKTSKKAPRSDDAETSQQLTFEALGWLAATGSLPDVVALDYFWLTEKTKANSMKTLQSVRTEEHVDALLRRVANAVEAVERGVFVPASPDSWQCSPKYCPYYDTCRYVKRPVQLQVVV